MFALFFWSLTSLHEIYILINFIDEPTQKNFLIMVFFYNYYIWGYLWTFYISILFAGLLAINHQQQLSTLLSDTLKHHKNLLVYLSQIQTIYNHPKCQQYRTLIKSIGDYSTAVCQQLLIVIYKSITETRIQPVEQNQGLKKILSDWYQHIPNLSVLQLLHKKLI